MAKKDKTLKQTDAQSMPGLQRDDALFETLGKNKKRKRRRIIITVVSIVLVLSIIAVTGVSFLQRRVREEFAASQGDVLSYDVTTGSISTVVSGSGSLTDVDLESVSVPDGVQITEVLVKPNQAVTQGDILATVDMASVISAMADLQTQIEELDAEISDAEDDSASTSIYADVTGRVKAIFGETDADVADVMYEYGALALISLDGYMAVDLETEALAEGDAVTVKLSDGEETDGTVESVVGSTATILVTDDGPEYDEEVTVTAEDGTKIGTGKLYIHNPLAVTGYAGTISTVNASLNQKVYASTTLFTLSDTSTSASYDALLRSRSEKEETLLELLKIQRYGGLTAPISGSVYSVADLDSDEEEDITDIIVLSPDESVSVTISVDEGDILSLSLGQEADVTVSSVSDETLTGTVTEIDKTDSSGAYTAVITLDKVEGMIPGMTASVDVRIEGVDDAILIPVDALHQTSTGYYVYTSYDEETQEYGGKVDVVPGISNSNYAEIKSGLSEGDTVYYTESQDQSGNMGFGNMPGGQMPNMGGNSGGGQGGGMPSGGNPGGGNPGGGNPGGGQPGGR